MWNLLGLLGLGGASFAGSAIMTKKQMGFQSREAQKQRDWLEQMSNSAHQREVADLRAAGLNPILSAGGSGADVSGGAAASIGQLENPVSSGIQAVKTVLDMDNVLNDTDLKAAQAAQSKAASADLAASAALKNAEQKSVEAETDLTKVRTAVEGGKGLGWRALNQIFSPSSKSGPVSSARRIGTSRPGLGKAPGVISSTPKPVVSSAVSNKKLEEGAKKMSLKMREDAFLRGVLEGNQYKYLYKKKGR